MEILVVDDEISALTTFLSEIVDERDWTYKPLRDPLLALEYAKKTPDLDAAFLDIQMPGMDGVELAKRLIVLHPAIKIVFISGHAQDAAALQRLLGSNLLGFCYKPYTREMLFGFLNTVSQSRVLAEVKTFGVFDVKVHGLSVRFSCAKAKELLAFLIHQGGYVSKEMAIGALFPDNEDGIKKPKNTDALYNDAQWRLKNTLKRYGLEQILLPPVYGQLGINPNRIDCDLIRARAAGKDSFVLPDEYMTQYGWANDFQSDW